MLGDRTKTTIEPIRRLLRRGAFSQVRKIVNKTHAADLSVAFRTISPYDQKKLFSMIQDLEQKGLVFSELDEDIFLRIVEDLRVDEIVDILDTMASDDVADLMERFPADLAKEILRKMEKEGSEEVEGLLRYDTDTAGGIMVPDFVTVSEDTTAEKAIASLQKEYIDVEMPFYLYVTDDYDRLVGVSSLRQLVVVPPETPVRDFMTRDVYRVSTDMDQEEVAKIVARYDILAVPVVDEENKLVGIITVDDVIDIIRREATEDMFKMAGVGEEFVETQSIVKSTRIRLPWLFASCLGGVLAYFIIGRFEASLKQMAYLAAFIPVIMGMGGNIGTQSSTIVVRGIATGRINIRDLWRVVGKELSVGLILGVFYGLVVGAVARITHDQWSLSFAVTLAVMSSMSIAALVGSMFPLIFARLHIDPAVATGPFVTTSIDILSVFFYFQIATVLLNL
ncbi:magnesium transporter [Desulfatibacillum alkenivorans DSM 16219]|jgi:magnesium transporter|uniref:Magnesium transporter MgtE n=1 Tax=Desulfatibacillum alkenivorans DSM 16219 TaxID=1121393 RepID=A0A1M7A8X0_9BACT|nr:magnesium transporter [Desulfatibacillum alkenivorans]SHL39056.1 magnesium transporter [Desulfatibacillum alkenivorans DSM 16219]